MQSLNQLLANSSILERSKQADFCQLAGFRAILYFVDNGLKQTDPVTAHIFGPVIQDAALSQSTDYLS